MDGDGTLVDLSNRQPLAGGLGQDVSKSRYVVAVLFESFLGDDGDTLQRRRSLLSFKSTYVLYIIYQSNGFFPFRTQKMLV